MMQSGNLDRRVTILRASAASDDGYTDQPGTLQIYAVRWADWRTTTVRERFEYQGTEGRAEAVCYLRSDSLTRKIADTDKIVSNGRVYDVLGVGEQGRNEKIEVILSAADGQQEIDLTGLDPLLIGSGDGIAVVGGDLRLDIDNLPGAI